MAVKRIVDTQFWQEPYIIDNYSVEDKYFMLYLMTNSWSSQSGIYSLPKKYISFETGYSPEVISVLIDRFTNIYGNIIYNNSTQEITLLNSLKFSIVKGGKPVSDLLKKELSSVKESTLILETYNHLLDFWENSSRPFDLTVRELFEAELVKRKLLVKKESSNVSNQNDNGNEKDNVNVNDNDNDDSYPDSSVNSSELLISDYESLNYYQKYYGQLNSQINDHLSQWIEKLSDLIVLEALQRSHTAENPIKYATTILRSWELKEVKTLEDVRKLDKKHVSRKSNGSSNYKEIIPSWMKKELED